MAANRDVPAPADPTGSLTAGSNHDGNQLARVASGETNRRACNLGVSGNETRLTKGLARTVMIRSHFKFERLGTGRDGDQGGIMIRELRVMPDHFNSLLDVYLSVLPAYLPLLPVPCGVIFWPDRQPVFLRTFP